MPTEQSTIMEAVTKFQRATAEQDIQTQADIVRSLISSSVVLGEKGKARLIHFLASLPEEKLVDAMQKLPTFTEDQWQQFPFSRLTKA